MFSSYQFMKKYLSYDKIQKNHIRYNIKFSNWRKFIKEPFVLINIYFKSRYQLGGRIIIREWAFVGFTRTWRHRHATRNAATSMTVVATIATIPIYRSARRKGRVAKRRSMGIVGGKGRPGGIRPLQWSSTRTGILPIITSCR